MLDALQGADAAACQPGGADALLLCEAVQVAASASPGPPAAPWSAAHLAWLTRALRFQAGVNAVRAVGGAMQDFQRQVACIAPALSIDAFQREAGGECM